MNCSPCCQKCCQFKTAGKQKRVNVPVFLAVVPCSAVGRFLLQAPQHGLPWNSLPDYLRDSSLSVDTFRRSLQTYLFVLY